jgi:serine protease Do
MAAPHPFCPPSISIGDELAEVAARLRQVTVQIRGSELGCGSGVTWQPDGLVVTNAHVATGETQFVEIYDGRVFPAKLLRREPQHDLAALRIAASGLPAPETRDPSSMRTGEVVLAVGNPRGEKGAFTVGMLSAAPSAHDVFLRADVRLAPGNSGGPLADARGRIIGINCMVANGFGMAVTRGAVERFLAARRTIGVTLQPLRVSTPGRVALGLSIVALENGGAAHLAGLRIGDVIVRANGTWLHDPSELSTRLQANDSTVALDVLRQGQVRTYEVVAQETPWEVA